MSEIEYYEISEEECEAVNARLIGQLKAYPDWYNRLADCHIKCSDIRSTLAVALWMSLDDAEVDALYAEAAFLKTIDFHEKQTRLALETNRTNMFLDRRSW